MIIKKALLTFFESVKKIYLWIFNFMVGKEEREAYRFFVHAMTIQLLFVYPFLYFRGLVLMLLTETSELSVANLNFAIMAAIAPVALMFAIRFMMTFRKK